MHIAARLTAAALAALLALGACRSQPAGPADQLVDAWIEASGGRAAWKQVKDVSYTVTTVWFDSTGVEVRRRPRYVWGKKNPVQVRIERTEAEGHYVQTLAGNGETWATLNGELLPDTVKATTEVPYISGDVMYWIGLPQKLRDPGVNLRYIEPDSVGSAGVEVSFGSGVGEHPGDRYFYYFDGDSPFPREIHYIEEGRTSVNRVRLEDFKTAEPLTYMGSRTFYNEQGITTKQLLISDVVINPGLADSLFLRP